MNCWCGGETKEYGPKTDYLQCKECGSWMLEKQPTPEWVREFYDLNNYWMKRVKDLSGQTIETRDDLDRADGRLAVWLQAIERHVGLALPKGVKKKAIEVGCAHGSLLEELRNRGWYVLGVEVHSDVVEWTKAKKGFDTIQGVFPDVDLPSCDVFLAMDVLEHALDPVRFVQRIKQILVPGGTAVIQVPMDDGYGLFPFGDYFSRAFDGVEHLFLFTRNSAAKLFADAGLDVIENNDRWGPLHEIIVARRPL